MTWDWTESSLLRIRKARMKTKAAERRSQGLMRQTTISTEKTLHQA